MPTTPKTSPGGNLYVGPSLTASLAGFLVSLAPPLPRPEPETANL